MGDEFKPCVGAECERRAGAGHVKQKGRHAAMEGGKEECIWKRRMKKEWEAVKIVMHPLSLLKVKATIPLDQEHPLNHLVMSMRDKDQPVTSYSSIHGWQ